MKPESKIHTTNYFDTFIEAAEDYAASEARIPVPKGDKKSIALQQYKLLNENPYKYTSDDVLFQVFADRNQIAESDYEQSRKSYFSKGQACFRASPLTKSHGFGVHADQNGKLAIYAKGSDEYQRFLSDPKLKKVKAMRTSKSK